MQRIQKKIYEKMYISITAVIWISGLLLAGSDSPYMPWLNSLGLILFFCASLALGKRLNPSGSSAGAIIYPRFCQRPAAGAMASNKKNQRVNTRYALGA